MTDKPGSSPSFSGNPFRSRAPIPATSASAPRGVLPWLRHLLQRLSLAFRVAASFALISMLLSVVGIGYAAYSSKDSDQAFSGGLSIALGFIASGAIGIYLLVDHYLVTIARIEQERHRAIEQLRVLENSMLRSDGLAAMAAGIAHDFKNLFAPFHLGLDVVERQPVDSQSRHMLGLMQNNLKQANQLIEELLVFGNVTSTEVTYRPVALKEMLAGYGDILAPQLSPGLELQIFIAENLPAIRANPEQVLRALQHLVLNARDAIPDGAGRITIRAEMHPHQGRTYVGLGVSDTGTGIMAEVLPQIFTPFFTTKSRGRGTGMGLVIVRGIIRGHQGDITITSVPGQGTTATLLFPPLTADHPGQPPQTG